MTLAPPRQLPRAHSPTVDNNGATRRGLGDRLGDADGHDEGGDHLAHDVADRDDPLRDEVIGQAPAPERRTVFFSGIARVPALAADTAPVRR